MKWWYGIDRTVNAVLCKTRESRPLEKYLTRQCDRPVLIMVQRERPLPACCAVTVECRRNGFMRRRGDHAEPTTNTDPKIQAGPWSGQEPGKRDFSSLARAPPKDADLPYDITPENSVWTLWSAREQTALPYDLGPNFPVRGSL